MGIKKEDIKSEWVESLRSSGLASFWACCRNKKCTIFQWQKWNYLKHRLCYGYFQGRGAARQKEAKLKLYYNQLLFIGKAEHNSWSRTQLHPRCAKNKNPVSIWNVVQFCFMLVGGDRFLKERCMYRLVQIARCQDSTKVPVLSKMTLRWYYWSSSITWEQRNISRQNKYCWSWAAFYRDYAMLTALYKR